MKKKTKNSRRKFLKTSAGAALAFHYIPSRLLGKKCTE